MNVNFYNKNEKREVRKVDSVDEKRKGDMKAAMILRCS